MANISQSAGQVFRTVANRGRIVVSNNRRQIRVLGPLQVVIDDAPAELRGRIPRALLGRLVIAHGETVPVERLVSDLWDGRPPASALSVLQVQVHKLRRVLEPQRPRRAAAEIVVSEAPGYALRLAVGEVDAWQFEDGLGKYENLIRDRGDALDPAERCRILDTVLADWHGPALASFAEQHWAAAEAARLTDLRLLAAESRARAALELDRPVEVVTGLRALVQRRPDREESTRLLATAQYRLGQQAAALATLRRTREYLGAELGVDPGRRLQDLEISILTQSDALDGPASSVATPPPERRARYPRQRAAALAAARIAREQGIRLVWLVDSTGSDAGTPADTVAAALRAQSWTVVRARCRAGDTRPVRVWAEIADRLGGGAGMVAGSLSGAGEYDIARTIVRRCRASTPQQPVALVLDELQHGDPATWRILRLITHWLRRSPVLVVLTARTADADPELRATAAALADRTAAWEESITPPVERPNE
ncbi:BTAD domain-containing putative transcriptional regulator [Nocardia sp. NBC_00511]|uniref:BTAD domain-containing putative transcriptional regulator n=1 Tax=Nocardia sp. NBC_00511 TaxID=2903591 RepID=UPI0030DF6DFA